MKISQLYGKSVFVDSNAFIYYMEGLCSEVASEIIRAGSKEVAKIKLITTTRICDEVLFKMTLIRARNRDKTLEGNTFKKLKKKPEIVKELVEDLEKVVAFFHSLNMEIITVDSRLLFQSLDITKEYGLFGNDAITVLVMRRRNMKYILSSDRDFDGVEWIKRIDALQKRSGK